MNDFVEARTMQMLPYSYAFRLCRPSELDQVPALVVRVPPYYGTDLAKQGIKGSVRIDFYIDETGAVRMPTLTAEDNGVLPMLALDALKQWKFSPPTTHGRAALVRAREEFRFDGGS
jgi:TonB family protein